MLYEEAVRYLFGLRKFGKTPGVVREQELLRRLGSPEKGLKIVHVAGTNGKGSVCAYLESILRGQGLKTGLFTSPHLVKVNERIKINNKDIDDDTFMNAFEQVYGASCSMTADGMDGAAFFDFVMAMAMLVFRDKGVDFVVMETGLGGRLDCTSAVALPVLSVITSVSLDHTEILGDTVEQIAFEKAGIIKKGVPVVFQENNAVSDRVILEQADQMEAPCFMVGNEDYSVKKRNLKDIDFLLNNRYYKNNMFSIHTTALYQVSNCALALAAAAVIDRRKAFDEAAVHASVLAARWEGRMEEIRTGFYIDGAHNDDGIRAFLQTAASLKAEHKYLLFSAVCEKDYDGMIREICGSGIFDGYIITELESSRALGIDVIEGEFRKYAGGFIITEPVPENALCRAMKLHTEDSLLFAAGSLYLVGAIKALLSS